MIGFFQEYQTIYEPDILYKLQEKEFPFDFFTVFLLYFNNNTLLNKFPIITFENS
jgi:hypothetical protein